MVQISTPWGDLKPGNGPPVRRFLSNYFDLLFIFKERVAAAAGFSGQRFKRFQAAFHLPLLDETSEPRLRRPRLLFIVTGKLLCSSFPDNCRWRQRGN